MPATIRLFNPKLHFNSIAAAPRAATTACWNEINAGRYRFIFEKAWKSIFIGIAYVGVKYRLFRWKCIRQAVWWQKNYGILAGFGFQSIRIKRSINKDAIPAVFEIPALNCRYTVSREETRISARISMDRIPHALRYSLHGRYTFLCFAGILQEPSLKYARLPALAEDCRDSLQQESIHTKTADSVGTCPYNINLAVSPPIVYTGLSKPNTIGRLRMQIPA